MSSPEWQSRIIHKKSGSSIEYENVVKMVVFRLFLGNACTDLDESCSEYRTNQFWEPRENRMSGKNPVLEIFVHKVQIFAKNAKSGV